MIPRSLLDLLSRKYAADLSGEAALSIKSRAKPHKRNKTSYRLCWASP
jgi:hypothetical protein